MLDLLLTPSLILGGFIGVTLYLIVRCLLTGLYTVEQNERAVITSFGKAERFLDSEGKEVPVEIPAEDADRYHYPQIQVVPPGGPYFKWPWQKVHKVSIATEAISIAHDPSSPSANNNGQVLDAVTKDHLNTRLTGQIRFSISEKNLYAYLFGIKKPVAHVMGFISALLRERIANFEAPPASQESSSHIQGISINDLRKNLRDLNDHMERECISSSWRYGIKMEAALITEINPPLEVESALAAINTAHNQVSSEISLAQAAADQKIVQSKRAVEIETLKAQAEVEPLRWMAAQLGELKKYGSGVLQAYLRNVRLPLFSEARQIVREVKS
jgi:regulator of protease activity HflC (stomatin/prohibitin superfamily)